MRFMPPYVQCNAVRHVIKSFKNINTVKISPEFKFVIKYYQVSQMVFPVNNPEKEFSIDKLSPTRLCDE